MKNTLLRLALTTLIGLTAAQAAATAPDAKLLLKTAESIRNPRETYAAQIALTDQRKGEADDVRTYEVSCKDGGRSLVKYLTPVVDYGTKVLMADGEMWVSLKGSAKPIKIAPRQKLAGNAAYGDIAQLNYDENYDPTFMRRDSFEGKDVYVLDLKAKEDHPVTYDRVEYWLEVATNRPVKALYQTVSGKTLREGYFTNYTDVMGLKRPLTLLLKDALDTNLVTRLDVKNLRKATLPDSLFKRENLK